MNELLFERYQPPFECRFVGCHSIWLQETRRLWQRGIEPSGGNPKESTEVRWLECPATSSREDLQRPGSLVIWESDGQRVDEDLRLAFQLTQRNTSVAVVGPRSLRSLALTFQATGCVALITDIFGCQRLIPIIQGLSRSRPPVVTEWRTRFVNRLPWHAV